MRGIDKFKERFAGHDGEYVLIGGGACDLPIATEERCLHDLVSRKRSLELIDWDEVDAD